MPNRPRRTVQRGRVSLQRSLWGPARSAACRPPGTASRNRAATDRWSRAECNPFIQSFIHRRTWPPSAATVRRLNSGLGIQGERCPLPPTRVPWEKTGGK